MYDLRVPQALLESVSDALRIGRGGSGDSIVPVGNLGI
jgi:hypothetical protein